MNEMNLERTRKGTNKMNQERTCWKQKILTCESGQPLCATTTGEDAEHHLWQSQASLHAVHGNPETQNTAPSSKYVAVRLIRSDNMRITRDSRIQGSVMFHTIPYRMQSKILLKILIRPFFLPCLEILFIPCSVVDLDPNQIGVPPPCGSGSVFRIGIQIHTQLTIKITLIL